MTYVATNERTPLFFVAFLPLILITTTDSNVLKLVAVAIFLCTLSTLFIRYTLQIDEQCITYTVTLYKFVLYKRVILPKDIARVQFQRIGWEQKHAKIRLTSGLPLRITLFRPMTVYAHIRDFCEQHDITYSETKDYQLLQKMQRKNGC